MIRYGSRGGDVEKLQQQLRAFDPHLAIDGIFGPKTERAVRYAQRAMKVYPPDGIVGPHTQAALDRNAAGQHKPSSHPHGAAAPPTGPRPAPQPTGSSPAKPAASPPASAGAHPTPPPPSVDPQVAAARERAAKLSADPGAVQPIAQLTTSQQGRDFIYKHETLPHISNHLYWPKGASGVTIGAGYDMKKRDAKTITADLVAVQVPLADAQKAAQGAGLEPDQAEAFAKANKGVLNLSDPQQAALLVHILPPYEDIVRRTVHIPLHQYEFDALVSFVMNSGGHWSHVAQALNTGRTHDAMQTILGAVYSKGVVLSGLARRRPMEVNLYSYGEYR